MILSFPLSVLQLVLLNTTGVAAYTADHHGLGTFQVHRRKFNLSGAPTSTFARGARASADGASSSLFAAASIDPEDPYAKVLEAYRKKSKIATGSSSTDPFSSVAKDSEAVAATTTTSDSTAITTDSISSILDTSSSSSSPTDSTIPEETTEKVQDIVQAINNAASEAMEASNQASEAAASISSTLSPTVQSTNVAETASAAASSTFDNINSGGSAPVEEVQGKVPTLFEYLSSLGSATKSDKQVSVNISPDVKEKLMILKNNMIPQGTTGLGGSSAESSSLGTKSAITAGAAAASSGGAVTIPSIDFDGLNLDSVSVDWAKLVENFQLEQYGAWYVTAFTFLYALNQKEVGKVEAQELFEVELLEAKRKAQEAANAAMIAAEGAKQAKEMVKNMPVEKTNVGEMLLESSKIRNLEVENDIMRTELSKLKSENQSQMTMISNLVKEKNKIQLMEVPSKASEIEIPLGKSTMERDPEEDKRILKILKNIDEENAKVKAPQKKATAKKKTKKERAPKKSRSTATSSSAKKSVTPATAIEPKTTVAPAPEPVVESATVTEPELTVESEPEPATSPKKSKTKKKRSSKKAAPKEEPDDIFIAESEIEPIAVEKDEGEPMEEALKVIEAAEESLNEALEESSRESAVIEELKNIIAKSDEAPHQEVADKANSTTKETSAKRKGSRKKKKGSETPPSDEMSNPWGSLKESTLKRKTVAELTQYLTERQVDVEGLSKTELVGTIQNL